MRKIHNFLESHSKSYSRWHSKLTISNAVHWLVMFLVVFVIGSSLTNQISDAYMVQDEVILNTSEVRGLTYRGKAIPEPRQDQILVKFKDSIGDKKKKQVLEKYQLKEKDELRQIKVKIVSVPDSDTAEEVVQKLLSGEKANIEFAELDHSAVGAVIPNDTYFSNQWHHPKISSPQGWDINTGSNAVTIAVVDSGVDPNHSDLAAKLVAGYNYLGGNTSDTHDVLGHGTAVAGSAGAISNNGIGVAGVNWGSSIMPLVVLNSSDFASYSNIANATMRAADQGVKVINISIGGTSNSDTLQNAMNYAWNKGAIIFASAMNNGNTIPMYPAALQNVVAVVATTNTDAKAAWSNYGPWVDVAAPGASIYTTNNNGGYGYWNGTSFSSPITAGLAALIFSQNPDLSNSQVLSLILNNTDDLGAVGFDTIYGWGRINIDKSLRAVGTTTVDTIAPTTPTDLYGSLSGSDSVNLTWTASVDNVGVTGYKVFRDSTQIGTAILTNFTDSAVSAGNTYTYTIQAFDATGNISPLSSLISVTVPTQPVQVSITSYSVTKKTATTATIVWTTNISSTGSVSYGLSNSNLNLSKTDGVVSTSHTVILSGLTKATKYFYKILATNENGTNTTSSAVSSFRTSQK